MTPDKIQLRLRAMQNLIMGRGYGYAHAFFYIAGDYIKVGVRFGLDSYGIGSMEAWFDDLDKAEEFVTDIQAPADLARAEARKALKDAQDRLEALS